MDSELRKELAGLVNDLHQVARLTRYERSPYMGGKADGYDATRIKLEDLLSRHPDPSDDEVGNEKDEHRVVFSAVLNA